MASEQNLGETLNTVFNNPNFIKSVVTSHIDLSVEEKLAITLKYYIATRDTHTNYSFDKILTFWNELIHDEEKRKIARYNLMQNGFLIHTCNGSTKKLIEKYGLNYASNPELKDLITHRRRSVNELEQYLGKSSYLLEEEKSNSKNEIEYPSIFVCTPGIIAIDYAINYSPERVFLGPLDFPNLNPLVGENKQQCYFRHAVQRLKEIYGDTGSLKYIKRCRSCRKSY